MDTWRCNFLGLPSGTHIPSHVELFVCVDIVDPEEGGGDGVEGAQGQEECFTEAPGLFDGYSFVIVSPLKLPEKGDCLHFGNVFSYIFCK